MEKAKLKIDGKEVFSKDFDDIYFDTDSGIDETKHVFIERNGLPEKISTKQNFTIVETGFGTGLNFLTLLSLYKEAKIETSFTFWSVEKHPIKRADLKNILYSFEELGFKDRLVETYPQTEGLHTIEFEENVTLKLFVGELSDFLPILETEVDCWFLDGFAPDKNPDMWSPELFRKMGEITVEGGTFASFTAAGIVKRGLRENGFFVKRYQGYGNKRHIISGNWVGCKACP